MAITVSPIESVLYSMHWGSNVWEAQQNGTSLTDASQLYGNVRCVYDKVTLDPGSDTWEPNTVIFFPGISENGIIFSAGLQVVVPSAAASTITLGLYTSNDASASLVSPIINNLDSDTSALSKDIYQSAGVNQLIKVTPSGCFMGLENTGTVNIVDGKFAISFLYSATN